MKLKIGLLVTSFILVLSLSGCVTRLGSFTVLSTKNIDWSRATDFKRVNNRVSGEDMYHIIIFIPTKGNITIAQAVDNAIESVPGAVALVDAVMRSKFFYLPYIYGQSSYIVEGSVLVDSKLVSEIDTQKYYTCYSKDGTNYSKTEVTQEEYTMLKLQYGMVINKDL